MAKVMFTNACHSLSALSLSFGGGLLVSVCFIMKSHVTETWADRHMPHHMLPEPICLWKIHMLTAVIASKCEDVERCAPGERPDESVSSSAKD